MHPLDEDRSLAEAQRFESEVRQKSDILLSEIDTSIVEVDGTTPNDLSRAKKAIQFLEQIKRNRPPNDPDPSAKCPQNPTSSKTPRRLGKYEILRPIGHGGFADVYLARDVELDRWVAIKFPKPSLLESPVARERFRREARAAAQLGHPQIVPVFEFGEFGDEPGLPYIVFEYAPGPTLADWLAENPNPVSPSQAAAIVERLALAIAHAHQRGVIHRDLKPGNLLIHSSKNEIPIGIDESEIANRIRIADFGLARESQNNDVALTVDGSVIGTPAYMSPEQASGKESVGPSSDLFSLGVILFELLTRDVPFKRTTKMATLHAVIHDPLPSMSSLVPRICPLLEAICARCLKKEPRDRYESAAALADDLRAWLDGRPVAARPETSWQRSWRWVKANPVLSASCMVTLMSLMFGFTVTILKYREARLNLQQVAEQRERAARHLERLESLADLVLVDLSNQLKDIPKTQSLRNDLLRKHLDLQLALIREEGDDEVVKTNTVKAHMRAVQLCRLLGEESQANQHAAEARRIANSIDDPSLELQLTLWDLDIHEIHLYIDRREYTSAAEKATAALNSVLSSNLGTDDHTELLIAKFYQQLGMSHEGLSEAEAAEQAYLSGLSALATGAYEHSIESNKLAAHLENSLAVLFNKTGRRNESLRHYESARNRLERLISDDPTRMDLHGLYAIVCSNLANHETRQKNWARAETLYRFAYESQNLVHSNDPKDVFALRNLAQTSGMLASSLARLKRIDEANLYFDRTETFVNQHPHPEKVADVYLRMLNNRARMTKEVLGDPKRAATLWTEAVRWQERNPTQSLTPDIVRSLAMAHEALGKMHLNESEFVQAKEDFTNQFLLTESALSIHPGQHDLVIERMLALENLVEVAVQSDNLLDALKLLEQLAGIADIAGEAVQRAAKGYERILPLALRAVEKGSIQESTLLEIQSRHRELVSASKQDGRSTGNRN